MGRLVGELLYRFQSAHLNRAMVRLTAVQYRHTFTSGHSCPCLIDGETLEGERFEVVVKLRESIDCGVAGLACELVASRLASALGLSVPTPFFVEVTSEYADSLPDPGLQARFRNNLGWHFASAFLHGQFHAVPYSTELPLGLIDPAAAVLAFDALVLNDDRHRQKSNYLIRGSTIMLIDHERAFPSARGQLVPAPWEKTGLSLVQRHVFFDGIRGQMPDMSPIAASFERLSSEELTAFALSIPDEWDRGGVARGLETYLLALRQNFRTVLASLTNLLR